MTRTATCQEQTTLLGIAILPTKELIISNELNAYRSARDSKPLEVVGTYNPLPQKPTNLSEEEAKVAKAFKEISIDRSRVKYWLGVGAQPTESVWRLLSLVRDIFITLMNGWFARRGGGCELLDCSGWI